MAGQSALMLNLSLHHTWKDLAEKPTEEIDGEMAMQVLLPHASGVHVLASPPLPHQAELVTAEHVKQVLDLLQRRFHYVVLDLPHDFSETTLAGLDTATDILLVLPPDLGSVRATAAALEAFQALGYAEEQIHLVQNWVFKRPGLPRKEMRPFSNAPFAGCCPTWPTPW